MLEQGRVQLDANVSVSGIEAAASDLEAPCDQLLENAFDGRGQVDGTELVDEPGNQFSLEGVYTRDLQACFTCDLKIFLHARFEGIFTCAILRHVSYAI